MCLGKKMVKGYQPDVYAKFKQQPQIRQAN